LFQPIKTLVIISSFGFAIGIMHGKFNFFINLFESFHAALMSELYLNENLRHFNKVQ